MFAVYVVAAFVVVVAPGAVVSRRNGARVHYIDAWTPADGEHRVHEDPAADFYVVPRLGQAKVMSFARRGRTRAVVTDRALVIAMKAAFSKRHIITHVIGLSSDGTADVALGELSGGLFSKGFIVLSAGRVAITAEMDGAKPYVRIVPDSTASATNIEHLRLYCEDTDRMRAALGATAASTGS